MKIPAKLFIPTALLLVLTLLSSCMSEEPKKAEQNYLRGELPVQEGMVVFNQNCASCHNFNTTEIGPNLAGITEAMDKEWIKRFIQNPQQVIENGDERAVAQFEKFGVYMPSFNYLKENELENLLAFIHKFSEGEKKNTSNRTGALINPIETPIPDSEFILSIEDFTTIPPSSDKAPDTRINTLRALPTSEGERLFIADLRGKIYEITSESPVVYLDVKNQLEGFIDQPGLGSGLGSFAFHPDFENNGLLYTTHTEPSETKVADFAVPEGAKSRLQWVLSEWKSDSPNEQTYERKRRELVRVDMVSQIHGFQELTFNPNSKPNSPDYGLLYLGVGDGGAALAGYPELCGNSTHIWGSVLRIDPLGTNSKNGKYGIPKDNPFVGTVGLGEIWCTGFRNPHRITWDISGSDKMFISNIGQHSVEEVNLGVKGAHYGWPFREGSFVFDVNANPEMVYRPSEQDLAADFVPPVIQYDHDEGNAVSGGFVYAGSQIPSLRNTYLFGDIPRGTLFSAPLSQIENGQQAKVEKVRLEINHNPSELIDIRPNERVDLRFGQNSSGEMFLFTKSNGKVYRIVDYKRKTASSAN